jgi:hypothetical protein
LVCGAYEAVSACKPLVLSNTQALKQHFHKGTVYTDNTSKDITDKILNAILKKDLLQEEIKELRREMIIDWERRKEAFEVFLERKVRK